MISLAYPAQKSPRYAAEPKRLTQEIHRETNSLGLWRKVESVQWRLLLCEGSHVCAVRCCGAIRSRMKAASRQVVNHPPPIKRKNLSARVGFFVCVGEWVWGSKPRDAGRLWEFGEHVSPPQARGRSARHDAGRFPRTPYATDPEIRGTRRATAKAPRLYGQAC